MKKSIHPEYFDNATISCACGAEYKIGSTQESIKTELCAKCHPFFTGKQKILDTARRVEKFQTRAGKKTEVETGKKAKKAKREAKKTGTTSETTAEDLKKKLADSEK